MYHRSCINYQGNKYKILNQLVPLFPKNINNFYDVFGGSGCVSLNTIAKNYHLNDLAWTNKFLQYLQNNELENILEKIESVVNNFCLSKTGTEDYKKFIKYINDNGLEKDNIYIYNSLL